MKFETKNTDALIYEINNFHLEWKRYFDKNVAKKNNISEYAIFYNDYNMWDVYNSASCGMGYEDKMRSLYEKCIKEIKSNLNNYPSKDDRISYLKRILPDFYVNDTNIEPVTYLNIQVKHVQEMINYQKEEDFMSGEAGLKGLDTIKIAVSGFDGKEFKHCSYRSLLPNDEYQYEDLKSDEIEQFSFVKTILSIKKKTVEKLERRIKAFIEIDEKIITQLKIKPKFSLPQLALMLHYKDEKVTRMNGNKIAKDYGHNSGERLFQLFTKYSSRQNRIGKEATRKKNLNKLALFEQIIPELAKEQKQRAIDEMKTLKSAFENGDQ
jgi:hypothetical protein